MFLPNAFLYLAEVLGKNSTEKDCEAVKKARSIYRSCMATGKNIFEYSLIF